MLAVMPLGTLRVNISAESIIDKDSVEWQRYQKTAETFGSDRVLILFFRTANGFTPAKLGVIRAAAAEVEALPYVTSTTSLFTANNIKVVDGYTTITPFLDKIPATQEQLQQILADAIDTPLIVDNLIARDGKSLAINIYVDQTRNGSELDQEIARDLDRILEPLAAHFDAAYHIGAHSIRNELSEQVRYDQKTILPFSLAVLLLILAISLKRAIGALVPLATACLSIAWTLGFMAILDIPINIMTSIAPALIVVIGSTEDIHLLTEYFHAIDRGHQRPKAIVAMEHNVGRTVLLTFVTTYIGFFSIALNNIDILYQFGLVTSTGLLFNFLITVTLLPATLALFGPKRSCAKGAEQPNAGFYAKLAVKALSLAREYRGIVLTMVAVTATVLAFGATQLRLNNNPVDFLEPSSPIRAQAEQVHRELSGIYTISIVLDSGIYGTFLHGRYLEEIEKIQRKISEMPIFDTSLSFADFLRVVNHAMAEEDGYPLPKEDAIINEYMLFIQHRYVSKYLSADYEQAKILVRHNISSSEELKLAISELQAYIEQQVPPSLKITITGDSILSNMAIDSMARGQVYALLLIGVAILLIFSLLFINLKAGVVALLPNLLPVLALFGIMGFFGIPLNAGTAMVAAIALGICIDDTMHLMSRFHDNLQEYRHHDRAIVHAVEAEAAPIIATSIALSAGFVTLATSSFIPVHQFGILSAMVIMLALVTTFVVTPLTLDYAQLLTVWDVISFKVRNTYIKNAPIFRSLNAWQIKKLLASSELISYKAGRKIVDNSDATMGMFIVIDGNADVRRDQEDGSTVLLRNLSPGDLCGEDAPGQTGTRNAYVTATTDLTILALNWRSIQRISRIFPLIAHRLYRNLTHILSQRVSSSREAPIRIKSDLTSIYNRIYFNEIVEREILRSNRHDTDTSLLFMEIVIRIDGIEYDMKKLEDYELQSITSTIGMKIREVDILGHWSKEKLAILLPHTPPQEVKSIVDRLTLALDEIQLAHGRELIISTYILKLQDIHLSMFRSAKKSLRGMTPSAYARQMASTAATLTLDSKAERY